MAVKFCEICKSNVGIPHLEHSYSGVCIKSKYIEIPSNLYKSLARIAYQRGFDTQYFIIQLLEHDLEVWEHQLSFIKDK